MSNIKELKYTMTAEQIAATGKSVAWLQRYYPNIMTKAKTAYGNMLHRCSDREKYSNVEVCEEWRQSQKYFILWYLSNYPFDLPNNPVVCLDKDLKNAQRVGEGLPALYSASTCLLIPNKLNLSIGSVLNHYKRPNLTKVGDSYRVKVRDQYYTHSDQTLLHCQALALKMKHLLSDLEDARQFNPENAYYVGLIYTNALIEVFKTE